MGLEVWERCHFLQLEDLTVPYAWGSIISSGWAILFFQGKLPHPIHPSLSENHPGKLCAPSPGIPQIEQSKTLMKRENSFPFILLSEIYLDWPVPELYYIKQNKKHTKTLIQNTNPFQMITNCILYFHRFTLFP